MKKIPVAILVALAVVVGAEGGVRAIAPRLVSPLTWGDREVQNKAAAIDALGARGGASVVFVGSSMTNAAADPRLTTRLLGLPRPAFNAAANGVDLVSMEQWTMDVVVPRLRPRAVVIGLSSRELNENGSNQLMFRSKFEDSPAVRVVEHRATMLQRLDNIASRYSYLVRYRSVLRRPKGAIKHPAADDVGTLGVIAALRAEQRVPYRVLPVFRTRIAARVLNDYAIGSRETDALAGLVTRLRARKISVVIVEMPLTDDAIALHTHGAADYEAFHRTLHAFVAGRSIPFVDLHDRFPSKDFFDPLHLSRTGTIAFTTQLANVLRTTLHS